MPGLFFHNTVHIGFFKIPFTPYMAHNNALFSMKLENVIMSS